MKHAYLVMCYNNFKILDKMIELLDSEDNDFYIHVDAKVEKNIDELLQYVPKKSKVIFTEREKIYWGSISEVKGNLILMKSAQNADVKYDYYHFMQGADFPIKSINDIEGFFEQNYGKEFIYIDPKWYDLGAYKFNYHHFFVNNKYYRKNKYVRIFSHAISKTEQFLRIQVGKEKVYSGSAMWSLSNNAIQYILSKENYILKRCKYALVPVEIIWHTLIMNSELKNNVYNFEKDGSNLYLIDWKRREGNSPHTFVYSDKDMLLNAESNMLYARKFNEDRDFQIIEELYAALK